MKAEKNGLLQHLQGGFVRLHILYHADKESICGADMMEELGRHGYHIGPGTMYPILHGLEMAGYLKCKSAIVNGKQRKNYRITPAGRAVLADAREKLRELVSEVIDDRDKRHPEEQS